MSPWECRPWREFSFRVGNPWTESITRRDQLLGRWGRGGRDSTGKPGEWEEELGEWLRRQNFGCVERAAGVGRGTVQLGRATPPLPSPATLQLCQPFFLPSSPGTMCARL